jgi:hypothetical protein
VSRCNEDVGRITVASFGVALPAGRPGRDPLFNLGLQPTDRVRGELTTGRKLPRHSKRQSVVQDSPVRAQTSRHRRKRAGERPTCAGWSDASLPSWLSRALLTSADATRWRLKVATCVHCGERIRSHYRDRADSLIFHQCVRTSYELVRAVSACGYRLHLMGPQHRDEVPDSGRTAWRFSVRPRRICHSMYATVCKHAASKRAWAASACLEPAKCPDR